MTRRAFFVGTAMIRTGYAQLDKLLDLVVARLTDQIPECSEANCFLTLNPDSVPASPGDFIFAVAPTAGSFSGAYLNGGGQAQATADTGVIVKIHSPLQLDEPGRERAFLIDNTHSILKQWRRVLRALTDWSPAIGDDQVTRDPLLPTAWSITRDDRRIGAIEQDFSVSFDMDLTAEME